MSVTEIFHSLEYGPAPEAAKPALEWISKHADGFKHFVDGAFVASSEDRTFEVFNPATAKTLATVAFGTKSDVDRAVEAAEAAFPAWSALSGHERARFLYAIARQIQKHARLFAVVESLDNGKPIRETRDLDIPLVARHFYYHAGWAQILEEELPEYQPIGVCGQIIPWNFPLLMLAWKIAPAIACGNTVVLKPAEFTPLTALLFAEICDSVGLPKGVVNIVTGDGETGRCLVEHPKVKKIAFTGSTEVGRLIRKATAGTSKKLSLELGGKSPYIVFEDADLDSAVEGLVDAIWFNQGQVCCAGSRLLVQESVARRVFTKIKRRLDSLRVGDPLDKAIDVGAIVDRVQLERISGLVEQGVREGATKFQANCALPDAGWFYPPTLLTDVESASTVAQVEIFGPVLVAMTFRTKAEAIALANNTPYGLAATVWTENLSLAHDVANHVKAGTVWVNCTNMFDAASGFGGYRESGFGREGGLEGLHEYLVAPAPTGTHFEPKTVGTGPIDRTHKLFIGGKQVRPDGAYSASAPGGEFAIANRKDVRNAVEIAITAQASWSKTTGHQRAQILFYIAENLSAERATFQNAGVSDAELDATIRALFDFAARADKNDGQTHDVAQPSLCFTRNEAIGVIGIACSPESSLYGLVRPMAAAIAAGNCVVLLASESQPLPAAELYRLLDMSDAPGGVVNILTGPHADTLPTLAEHDGVDAIWLFAAVDQAIVAGTTGNLKQVWQGASLSASSREFLRRATQVKNVWVSYGD